MRDYIDTDAEADAVGRDEDAWWNERDALADHRREPAWHVDHCTHPAGCDHWGDIEWLAQLRKVTDQ